MADAGKHAWVRMCTGTRIPRSLAGTFRYPSLLRVNHSQSLWPNTMQPSQANSYAENRDGVPPLTGKGPTHYIAAKYTHICKRTHLSLCGKQNCGALQTRHAYRAVHATSNPSHVQHRIGLYDTLRRQCISPTATDTLRVKRTKLTAFPKCNRSFVAHPAPFQASTGDASHTGRCT